MQGILECVRQLESGTTEVRNTYGRSVTPVGNQAAQRIVETVYEIDDREWRGLGVIPAGGFRLRKEFASFDAQSRFGLRQSSDGTKDNNSASVQRCRAGEVLSGQLKPCDCSEFGRACTPDSPLGAPMVSSEGACAAYHRYRRGSLL